MSKTPYLTAPIHTDKMPPGIKYIVGNEAAERFNFYGMRAILVVYMTKYLVDREGALAPMSENEASAAYHWFLFANYFFPMLGAIVADAFWGKYRTIFWISLVYCLGSVVLAIDHTRLGLTLGLTLIAIGSGGIKPCVSSNVGDQFGPANQHLLSKAFGWFYFSINFGSFFSILLIPVLLERYGPFPAFGVPAVLMLLATFVFWKGRYKFAHIPPSGTAYFKQVFNREGLSALGRLSTVFVFIAIFWSLWDQSGGEWVLQAEKMNLRFLGINWLASQVQAVNAIMVLAFIPVFQYLIYPLINRVWTLTPLRKIGMGLIVAGLSFMVSAWIETQIAAGLKPSIGWQLPAYALLTAAEIMVSITGLEFAYTQAPRHMKAMVQALYLLSISAGNAFTALVHVFIENPDGTVKLHGASYYLFFSALSIGCVAVYVFVAKAYKERSYLQGEAAATT
ncbi:POT family MFS transporter [Opitutus terrae]|uniref:TGF-beta receptor type I/II extracellular region n=1 Tax=Opitutus terrae (strain DSM 11246 / JCM 15787 / PB90-1) TaxID=452637 RepID=B1ZSQ7_OPITP|nr:POT family MFS transporter [Opitutus terrae]ACB74808.1 TGF-beta receptor type I/II extracellular region [Opitutus terrae PB90-1]